MSGEMLLVRRALVWGSIAACAGAGLAFAVRGTHGAASVGVAAGLVLGNTFIAAGLAWVAGRMHAWAGMLVALPSFALRMGLLFLALQTLKGASFIDEPTFALAFALAVTATLVLESRTWKRTPWIALTLKGDN